MTAEEELNEAMNALMAKGELPQTEELLSLADKWKAAVNSPYRLESDKDFMAGAIFGIKLVLTINRKT